MATTTYPVPSTIEGPCLVQLGSGNSAVVFESKDDVKLQITDETEDVSTKTRGVLGQKLKGRKIEVKFKPVKWSAFSTLFAVLKLTRGQSVFGKANTPATIFGIDGQKVELPRAAITGIPSIGCGVGKYGAYLAGLGCDVTLTDISENMIAHACENMAPYKTP